MSRQIRGLRWVKEGVNPHKKSALTPWQRQGLAYERRVARALPKACHGPWLNFEDENGFGACQPDLVLAIGENLWVLEVKLTYTEAALAQLEGLYLPVLGAFYKLRPRGLVVAKAIGRGPRPQVLFPTLREALAAPEGPIGALLASFPTPTHARHQFFLPH